MKVRSKNGFSFIEVLVTMAVVGTLFALIMDKFTFENKAINDITTKLKARHVLDRLIADLMSQSEQFMPVSTGSQYMTYVSCYTKEGIQVKNNKDIEGFWLASLEPQSCDSQEQARISSSGRCLFSPSSRNAFEVQVRPWNKGAQILMQVSILSFNPKTEGFVSLYCNSFVAESEF